MSYNADYARKQILTAIAATETPVKWVVVDATPHFSPAGEMITQGLEFTCIFMKGEAQID